MIEISRKKQNFYNLVFLGISLILIFELLYQPNIEHMKSVGGFLTVDILGFRFLLSEIVVYSFSALGIYHLFLRSMRYSKKIVLAPKAYSPLPGILFLLICLSCIMGFHNPWFLMMFRKVLLPVGFFVVCMNVGISPRSERGFFSIVVFGGIALSAISLIHSMGLGSLINITWKQPFIAMDLRLVTVLTVFSLNVATAKLLFSRFSLKWLSVFLLCVANLFYNITLKSDVSAFLISCVIMLYIKAKSTYLGKTKVMIVALGTGMLAYIMFVNIVPVLPLPKDIPNEISFGDYVARKVGWRYFKIDITSADEFNLKRAIFAAEADISSTRFAIWKAYMRESLKGFGIAPYGFGHGGVCGMEVDEVRKGDVQGAHNIRIVFALNSGLLAALILTLLIMRYVYLNTTVLSKLRPGIYIQFGQEELIALFAFSISIIGISMFEGSIHNIHVACTFWFCVAVLLKRWDLLKDYAQMRLRRRHFLRPTKVLGQAW